MASRYVDRYRHSRVGAGVSDHPVPALNRDGTVWWNDSYDRSAHPGRCTDEAPGVRRGERPAALEAPGAYVDRYLRNTSVVVQGGDLLSESLSSDQARAVCADHYSRAGVPERLSQHYGFGSQSGDSGSGEGGGGALDGPMDLGSNCRTLDRLLGAQGRTSECCEGRQPVVAGSSRSSSTRGCTLRRTRIDNTSVVARVMAPPGI